MADALCTKTLSNLLIRVAVYIYAIGNICGSGTSYLVLLDGFLIESLVERKCRNSCRFRFEIFLNLILNDQKEKERKMKVSL
jgi:hypothetical protein